MSGFNRSDHDVERAMIAEPLHNKTINNFTWDSITVTVTDRKTKSPKKLLDNVSGDVKAGKIIGVAIVFHGRSDGFRRDCGTYGSLWIWENNTSKHSSAENN